MHEQGTKPTKVKAAIAAEEKARPVHTIAEGSVNAAIFRRQSPSGFVYHSYNLKRSYRSLTTGKEAYSSDFFAENQADLATAVVKATGWIAGQKKLAEDATKDAA